MNHDRFLVRPGARVKLKDFDAGFTGKFTKEEALKKLERDARKLGGLQSIMYAQNQWAALGIYQAFHGAGKDTVSRDVMEYVHSAGCETTSFGKPSPEELDHDYLWRCARALPQRGRIGSFIRSYYEEVLVVRMFPEILAGQHLPEKLKDQSIWKRRFREINDFERYLTDNGMVVLKFFLHVSKEEQWERMMDRIKDGTKNWKFSLADVQERIDHWKDYHRVAEDMLGHTSTENAPWYVVPTDHKWFAKMLVADIWVSRLKGLKFQYPKPTAKHRRELEEGKRLLLAEKRRH